MVALTALTTGLSVSVATPSRAAPVFGGRLYATGSNVSVVVKMLPAQAGYTSELWLFSPGPAREIATNREVGKTVDLGRFKRGVELVFGVHIRDTGKTFKMGPASRNGDGLVHAVVDERSSGRAVVGFEDQWGGGDWDFDDDQFEVTGGMDDQPVVAPDARGVLDVVLLGDSFSAGNGARDASGKRDYYGPKKCYRSRSNWAEKYVAGLRAQGQAVNFRNRACSGGVADDLTKPRFMDAKSFVWFVPGVYKSSRNSELQYRLSQAGVCRPSSPDEYYDIRVGSTSPTRSGTNVFGTCRRTLRPQIEAVTSNTDLVVFTMGGNDIGFSRIVEECFAPVLRDPGSCRDRIATANQELKKVEPKLTAAFGKIRARTKSQSGTTRAKIAFLGYPYLERYESYVVGQKFCIWANACVGDTYQAGWAVRRLAEAGGAAQARAVAAANKAAGVTYVTHLDEVRDAFHESSTQPSRNHEPSALTSNPKRWLNEIADTRIKMEWYHPNALGQTAYANTLRNGAPHVQTRAARLGGADVVLAVDTTSSMGPAIAALREQWSIIAASAAAGTDNVRYSLVTFGDSPDAPLGRPEDYASRVDVPFDTDPAAVQAGLDRLEATGGGDRADAALSAAFTAISQPWREGVKKILVLVTDAPAREPETFDGMLSAQDVQAAADAADPVAVSVVDTSDQSPDPVLGAIAQHTAGDVRSAAPAELGATLADLIDRQVGSPYAFLPDAVSGTPGHPITFDASASFHPDGALIGYDWDFDGDGIVDASTESPTVDHVYPEAYRGLAAVHVADEQGRVAIATTEVIVDSDADDVDPAEDNCPSAYNPDQEDVNGDGVGDACDDAPYPSADRPGVFVADWTDPDGDSTLDSVTTFLKPHANTSGRLASGADQDWWGFTWKGGTLQGQLVSLRTDLDLFLLDQGGRPITASAGRGNRSEKIRRKLPAGRYFLVVNSKATGKRAQKSSTWSYRLNITRVARR